MSKRPADDGGVQTFRPTTRATATWYAVKWKPKAKGTYRYSVYAKDVAGNGTSSCATACPAS